MDYNKEEITEYFDDWLADTMQSQGYEWIKDNLEDLHHHAFNTDYYIIARNALLTGWVVIAGTSCGL